MAFIIIYFFILIVLIRTHNLIIRIIIVSQFLIVHQKRVDKNYSIELLMSLHKLLSRLLCRHFFLVTNSNTYSDAAVPQVNIYNKSVRIKTFFAINYSELWMTYGHINFKKAGKVGNMAELLTASLRGHMTI